MYWVSWLKHVNIYVPWILSAHCVYSNWASTRMKVKALYSWLGNTWVCICTCAYAYTHAYTVFLAVHARLHVYRDAHGSTIYITYYKCTRIPMQIYKLKTLFFYYCAIKNWLVSSQLMKGNCNSSDSIMRTCIKKDEVLVPHYLLITFRLYGVLTSGNDLQSNDTAKRNRSRSRKVKSG